MISDENRFFFVLKDLSGKIDFSKLKVEEETFEDILIIFKCYYMFNGSNICKIIDNFHKVLYLVPDEKKFIQYITENIKKLEHSSKLTFYLCFVRSLLMNNINKKYIDKDLFIESYDAVVLSQKFEDPKLIKLSLPFKVIRYYEELSKTKIDGKNAFILTYSGGALTFSKKEKNLIENLNRRISKETLSITYVYFSAYLFDNYKNKHVRLQDARLEHFKPLYKKNDRRLKNQNMKDNYIILSSDYEFLFQFKISEIEKKINEPEYQKKFFSIFLTLQIYEKTDINAFLVCVCGTAKFFKEENKLIVVDEIEPQKLTFDDEILNEEQK